MAPTLQTKWGDERLMTRKKRRKQACCSTVFLRHVSSTKVKPLSQPGGQLNPFPSPRRAAESFYSHRFPVLSAMASHCLELAMWQVLGIKG
eukprot:g67641.t1